jgi:hypothetical protein
LGTESSSQRAVGLSNRAPQKQSRPAETGRLLRTCPIRDCYFFFAVFFLAAFFFAGIV